MSLQEILSLMQFEAESNAKLTSASIDVVARSSIPKSPMLREASISGNTSPDRTKLKRFYSLLPRPSWTPARHWDIQGPLSLASSEAQDAWAAPADQKAEQAQAEYDVIPALINANTRQHGSAGLQGQPSASLEQNITSVHRHGPQSSDVDPSVSKSHSLPSEYFTTDSSEDAITLTPGTMIRYLAPSALSNGLDIQATPTDPMITSKLAERDATHAPANDNDAPLYQLTPTVLTDLAIGA